jgi:ABC-type transport system involved in cytochrome bd biosynthesis fused ATPase/permease subunit
MPVPHGSYGRGPAGEPETDPVLARRARFAALANLGLRIGYLLLAVAVIAFIAGFALGFPAVWVGLCIAGLVGTCIVLPPAIIVGYAVKAAEREDRLAGHRRQARQGRQGAAPRRPTPD